MKKIMLDTQIFDRVIADKEFREKLQKLVKTKKIKFLITHAQLDEIKNIPNKKEAKRVELLKLIKELNMKIIPTEGAIFDVSRFDMAKLSDDTKTIEHLRNYKKEENPSRDALIAITSLKNADSFVTNDANLRKRILELNPSIEIKNYQEFRKSL